MEKTVCPYCRKRLSSERNCRLHLNICKINPKRHEMVFLCSSCPKWCGFSEQSRTEHLKSKHHRNQLSLLASKQYNTPSNTVMTPTKPKDEYKPRPFNYFDIVIASPLSSEEQTSDN